MYSQFADLDDVFGVFLKTQSCRDAFEDAFFVHPSQVREKEWVIGLHENTGSRFQVSDDGAGLEHAEEIHASAHVKTWWIFLVVVALDSFHFSVIAKGVPVCYYA